MRILGDLLTEAAADFGPRPALAMRRGLRTRSWSYAELADSARAAAARLASAGAQPGDRLLLLAPNSPELVVSMFGAWQLGAVLVPLDLRTPEAVIGSIVEQTSPRLAIASTPLPGQADLPVVSPLALADPLRGPATPHAWDSSAGSHHDLAEIVYTSGTTGQPKGVMLTHTNILANVSASLEALPFARGQRLLSILPLSHMLEQTSGLLAPLRSGATIYYAGSRRSSALLAELQRAGVGLIVCVPEVLRLLLAAIEREVERRGQLRRWRWLLSTAELLPLPLRPLLFGPVHRRLGGRLRAVICGGAALDPALWRTWERLGVRVVQGYGATECAPVVTSNRLDRRLADAVGWPLRGTELRLAADGEILVRGPNVTPGYYRDPAATAAAFDDGWYRSGDLGALGPRGELRLLGRKKDLIVLADGRNVYPHDVETELKRDPAISECVVVGKPRAGSDDEVFAAVIPARSAEEALAAVRAANERLAPHQRLSGAQVWPEADFPRTPSLKIKRAAVREALCESHHAPPEQDRSAVAGTDDQLLALLARLSGRPRAVVRPEADLALDLGLDSLARIELAVVLEEELGRLISDETMAAARTVAELRAALERADPAAVAAPLPAWPRRPPARLAREVIQRAILFPLLRRLAQPWRIAGVEWLRAQPGPLLIVANHSSHLDSVAVLATLPPRLRRQTAVAAAADYFFRSEPLATFSALVLGAFPFHRVGPVSQSLSHCGDLVDAGCSILIFPEGTRSPAGTLLPLKPGIGLLARELRLPVLPIYLDGLHRMLPKGRALPRPGPLTVRIGPPILLEEGCSTAEAVASIEAALQQLAVSEPPDAAG